MEITEPRRLYQQLAADLKERIEQGVYLVGDKLPNALLPMKKTSAAPWFVKPSSCWKLKAMSKCVKVQVFMWFPTSRAISMADNMEFANYGPFELLQARQLIESNIAEFAATQVTKQDIMKLMAIQEHKTR